MAAIKLSREWFTPKPDDGNLSLSTRELRIRAAVQMLNSGDWIELEDGTRCTSEDEIQKQLRYETGLSTIVCPNCGANTSNHYNCEYCGSLLVRFIDKNIDIKLTPYADNSIVLPGLIDHLQRNLDEQKRVIYKNDEESLVSTDIYGDDEDPYEEIQNSNLVRFFSGDEDETGERIFPDVIDPGLAIVVGFGMYSDASTDIEHAEHNSLETERYQRFRNLACFPLFKKHTFTGHISSGEEMRFFHFAIDFGEDVEGAARLLSDYLINVRNILPNTPPVCYTNVGEQAIFSSRERIAKERSGSGKTLSEVAPFSQLWEIDTTSLVIIIVIVALLTVLFIIVL